MKLTKKGKKGVLLSLGLTSIVPAALALSSCSVVDLRSTIVINAEDREMTDANGNKYVSHAIRDIWKSSVEKWKEKFPEEAAKYDIKWTNLGSGDVTSRIRTQGFNQPTNPDIIFYQADKMSSLKVMNSLLDFRGSKKFPSAFSDLAQPNKYFADEVTSKGGLKHGISSETVQGVGSNVGIPLKVETVESFINYKKMFEIFDTEDEFKELFGLTQIADAAKELKSVAMNPTWDEIQKVYGNPKGLPLVVSNDKKRDEFADFFSKHFKLERLGEMAKRDAKQYATALELDYQNFWFTNPLIYSQFSPKNAFINSTPSIKPQDKRFLKDSAAGEYKEKTSFWSELSTKYPSNPTKPQDKITKTLYDLYHASAEANIDIKDRFKKGDAAFYISGPWEDKGIVNSSTYDGNLEKFIYTAAPGTLYSNAMRHYMNGWLYGVNNRNINNFPKQKAIRHILEFQLGTDAQKKWYKQVENFISSRDNSSEVSNGTFISRAGIKFISNHSAEYIVNQNNLPEEYHHLRMDQNFQSMMTQSLKTLDKSLTYESFTSGIVSLSKELMAK
ncbi:hypothetical protein [Mycoplasma todarodis]|uniref:ABC transporter substrate-binding protein n=1 Tax=Mycoplasma todarodis TaxID=1937191 RepID=A0A4R0XVA5_9MOLU|nr:hypothetical protein [Mycoplasma todarodis]TCG11659.1 hypothetical protein C4B25_00930 [Mycoplasma todarodis]